MQPQLLDKLVALGIIRQKSVLQAKFRSHGLSGQPDAEAVGAFFLVRAAVVDGAPVFYGNTREQPATLHRFAMADILLIDGMVPARIALTFNLLEDGTSPKTGKRRGRKRKIRAIS